MPCLVRTQCPRAPVIQVCPIARKYTPSLQQCKIRVEKSEKVR
jgi:hypothetical protein